MTRVQQEEALADRFQKVWNDLMPPTKGPMGRDHSMPPRVQNVQAPALDPKERSYMVVG